jgi:Tfp pilus assembly major pilin PilA
VIAISYYQELIKKEQVLIVLTLMVTGSKELYGIKVELRFHIGGGISLSHR